MVRNDDRIPDSKVNVQLGRGLPGILRKTLPHVGSEDGVRAMADFRICIEEPQSSIGNCNPGPTQSVIGEQELSVLIIRASWASLHVDLVIVVLAGALKQRAELQRVVSPDPGKAVGEAVDGTRRVRGIGAATQPREVGHVHGWYARRNQFPLREYVRVIEIAGYCRLRACLGAVEKVRRVDGYPYDVLACGDQHLIDLTRADGPYIVQRASLVGAIEKFRRAVRIAVKRLVLQIGEIRRAEPQPVLLRHVHIDRCCILALVESMPLRGKPVSTANERSEVGSRPRIQDSDSVRAQSGRRNNVACKASTLISHRTRIGRLRVLYENRDLVAAGILARDIRIIRIKQLAEIALSHFG